MYLDAEGFCRKHSQRDRSSRRSTGAPGFKLSFDPILMLPGIVATVVFAFLESWNLYLIPFVLTYSTKSVPLTVGIAGLVNEHKIDWGQIMAASTIAALPTLIVFLFFEKYLVANLTAGAIKQ